MALSSPPPPDGSQDLHENLHSIGDAAYLGYRINCKMSCTGLNYSSSAVPFSSIEHSQVEMSPLR